MQKLPVQSRIIDSVYFSPENGQLQIRFRNGEERRFEGLAESDATALCAAPSPGHHYLEHIRKRFRRLAA
ncbi:KTSC domain-containing protein [Rhizobium rhizosphaerae]|uniref:KTSC domain-containing protein n=1 Tax=Xaviernesmea rhizosphaerae TaxID=1672749 RepID=A0A1Q9AJH4_9HYPH|nr:KTSC domain-containing protein [Xaviernesmea rhizosphaerae]OLP55422.1 KTSC domain-containing protein [Xaviernesmea rhizosphaerae]OQP85521.1 KTSC domain-containing protein [Xaviernesmea rhizosphaerae]